jgi:hypothetical protein
MKKDPWAYLAERERLMKSAAHGDIICVYGGYLIVRMKACGRKHTTMAPPAVVTALRPSQVA